MSTTRIASRYAKALFKLCDGDLPACKKYLDSIKVVAGLYDIEASARVLRSPIMPSSLKRDLIAHGLKQAGADERLGHYFDAIIDAQRVEILPTIVEAFEAILNDAEGIVSANVTSAAALSAEESKSIQDILSKILEKKIQMNPGENPELLGGFVAHAGQYRIDMSVKSKLEKLAQEAASSH